EGGREGSGRGPLYGRVLDLCGGVVDGRAVPGWGSGQDLDGLHEGPRGLRLFLALGEGPAGGWGHLRRGGAARQPEPAGVDRAHLAARAHGGHRRVPALRAALRAGRPRVPRLDGGGAGAAAGVGGRGGGVAAPVLAAAGDAGARAGVPGVGYGVGGGLDPGPRGEPAALRGRPGPRGRPETVAGAGPPLAARAAALGRLRGGVRLWPRGDVRRARRGGACGHLALHRGAERGIGERLLGQRLDSRGDGPILYGASLRAERGDAALDGLRGLRDRDLGRPPHRREDTGRGGGRAVGARGGLPARLAHRLAQLSGPSSTRDPAPAGAGPHRAGAVPARPAGHPGAVAAALERAGHRRRHVRAHALPLRAAGALGPAPARRGTGAAGTREGGV
ncbi:MAG: hypothetical protein AVDCRST_MAG01-01-49, partial [uncultured Rubrobacteraceae bacterium]